MVLGNVERLEIVVGRLDLRPFDHAEPDGEENPQQLVERLPDQVPRADRPLHARQREIDLIPSRGRMFRRRFNFLALFFERRFDVRLQLLKFLADYPLELRRRCLQPVVGDVRENPGLAADPSVTQNLPLLSPHLGIAESRAARRHRTRCYTSANTRATLFGLVHAKLRRDVCVSDSMIVILGSGQGDSLTAQETKPVSRVPHPWCVRVGRLAETKHASTPRACLPQAGFGAGAAFICCFADATSDVNPSASRTAISARIFRSTSIPPAFSP